MGRGSSRCGTVSCMTQTIPDSDSPAHQDFEVQWWGDCTNTLSEEVKQITYANRMGLLQTTLGEKWPIYDLGRRRILDVGGGPTSLLLKCVNVGRGSTVVDPGKYPAWTLARYETAGIEVVREPAEGLSKWNATSPKYFDEAWCYNVLQHVVDPYAIIANMRRLAVVVRIFEWPNTAPSMGHPHTLKPEELDAALGGTGTVALLDENNCKGLAYYGTFSGD